MKRREFLNKMVMITGSVSVLGLTSACHKDGTYQVDQSKCTGCGDCQPYCNFGAITISEGKASISSSKCAGCGKCVGPCKEGAISS